ncbi:hypothetical protein LGH83_04620 [Lichenihabitans sp. PAMC28606]|uniref:phage baseplate assembly protein n=1 Tax=Lichenihabitans sp. PAMC28606 TaxID=2880932 RepID=UPI001D0B2264|nr:hypothetical protein [Lichenihabitans sp. PAMC28606]UDL95511.1 hypothetical protein LGH83_04620 [Lichenihabitans sp. PAMC28606]
MGLVTERISIVVDGYGIQGFQSVEVTRSMQDGAMSFTLEATAASWSSQALALRTGKQIQIYTSPDLGGMPGSGDLLLTGAVDEYDSEIGEKGNRSVRLSGRSKGRNAIDCSPVKHKTGMVKNKTLLQAAQEFDEFGVGWSTDQQLKPVALIQRQPEEAMYDTIEREARKQGLMLVAQTDGTIQITRAGTKRHAGGLVLGQSPVNSMGVVINTTHKRSPVVVRGQRRSGTGKKNLRQEYQDTGDDDDEFRPALVIAEGDHSDDELQTRAKWERLRMAAFGIRPRARVSRWRDDAGMLWTPGLLVSITNAVEQVDGDYTLSSVTLSQTDGEGDGVGTRASMEFVDPRSHGGKKGAGKSDDVFSPGDGL